ncbi:MAG: hypothetical protein ACPIOQ_65915, partial [Promethearchaeia archaeon]
MTARTQLQEQDAQIQNAERNEFEQVEVASAELGPVACLDESPFEVDLVNVMPCVEGGLLVYILAVPTAIDPSNLHPIFVSSAGVSATVVLFVIESHSYYL